ncbi:MAG: 2-amino-4-hydroxy-6-hydroxymethyldihydropteridine diphosphokinase [Lachnospiraceae bacterium]|nr:2-amino-4-hydroxy-6-hydroxymethyldihydropteridine diphosphokinase [Lachnospiraceae bacterium]
MDEIKVTGLLVRANHGVYDFEKEKGQKFVLDITLFVSTQRAGLTDDLSATINYGEVARFAQQEFTRVSYDLIEAAAENLAISILKKFSMVNSVEITVSKPEAPIEIPFTNVSVTIRRKWHKAYLSVGSNIGESETILERAAGELADNIAVRSLRRASVYKTKPYGYEDQPDFTNSMWEIETVLTPVELLRVCNEIEAKEGRTREIHWGPRTLDIDIVYYDSLTMNTESLTIPHADMENRLFVLEPLNELAPSFKSPRTGKTAAEMIKELNERA